MEEQHFDPLTDADAIRMRQMFEIQEGENPVRMWRQTARSQLSRYLLALLVLAITILFAIAIPSTGLAAGSRLALLLFTASMLLLTRLNHWRDGATSGLWFTLPMLIIAVVPAVWCVVDATLGAVGNEGSLPSWSSTAFILLGVGGFILMTTISLLYQIGTTYALTDRNLYLRTVFPRKEKHAIPLADIDNLKLSQSVFERILGFGNLGALTSSGFGVLERGLMGEEDMSHPAPHAAKGVIGGVRNLLIGQRDSRGPKSEAGLYGIRNPMEAYNLINLVKKMPVQSPSEAVTDEFTSQDSVVMSMFEQVASSKRARLYLEDAEDEEFEDEAEEEITDELSERREFLKETLPQEEGSTSEVTVSQRNVKAIWARQMKINKPNKLRIHISDEMITIIVEDSERTAEGSMQLISRDAIVIRPVFPGCIVTPIDARLDPSDTISNPDTPVCEFTIVPMILGEFEDEGCVQFLQSGFELLRLQTGFKVVRTTMGRIAATFSAAFFFAEPLLGVEGKPTANVIYDYLPLGIHIQKFIGDLTFISFETLSIILGSFFACTAGLVFYRKRVIMEESSQTPIPKS